MRIILAAVASLLILIAGFFAFNSYIYTEKQVDGSIAADYKDGTYLIDGEFVTLTDGVAVIPLAPGSASMKTVRYFGNETRGDFDRDGDEDIAFIITVDGGGSGVFFYVVGAVKVEDGYRGTPAILLGDRIAPQTTNFMDGLVVVNYADRKEGEAMATVPSIGKSMYLKLDEYGQFGEVIKDFEGEIDLNRFPLGEYHYRCGDGTEFSMRPSADVSQILILPTTSVERIPRLVLGKVPSDTGAKYSDGDYEFHAHGESVAFSSEEFETTCTPMTTGEAPFNFGD